MIFDSVFDKNDAGNRGGAIDWLAQKGNITYSNFTRNTAHDGGALYLNGESSQSVLSHLIFESNTATGNGGAIDCNATLVNLTHTQFTSNRADYGAALCRENGATGGFGINNTFIKNHAYTSGAALAWLSVSNIHINNYTFINNTADYGGAAIYVGPQSDNCIVDNSTFEDNYVSNAISGRGGAIDWIGNNGTIINTNFTRCISVNAGAVYVAEGSDNMTINNTAFTSCSSLTNGGALVLNGDNVTIIYSNFISSVAMVDGGAIAGFNSDNANISYCYFKYNVAAGHIDVDGSVYGEGGAIYWENSTNLRISNSKFKHNEAHLSGGSISADNCNNSVIYNIDTDDETAFRNGGSIAWINSNNVNITDSYFYDSGANYCGGTIYLSNVYDINVKDSDINATYASWDYGGAIYVDGNVTIANMSFNDTHSDEDYGTALYFHSGNSTVFNCTFENAKNTILINKTAEVHLTKNNITADKPTKGTMYLTDVDDEIVSNIVNYAVWNDGDLYLDKNNFDYVIYNNGTIWTPTTTKMLNNESYNVTWMDNFTFFANITDDNLNTIISVRSLNTTNDVYQDVGNYYILPYNSDVISCIYQGSFHLVPIDSGLKKNTVYKGTLNVKMPVNLTIDVIDVAVDGVLVNATLKPIVKSNYTVKNEDVNFKIYDGDGNLVKDITVKIEDIDEGTIANTDFVTWTVANLTLPRMNLGAGTYTVTANYSGDTYHLGSIAINTTTIHLRQSWIKVAIENITYGQNIIAVITTNSNGTVHFNLHGRKEVKDVDMTKGADGNYTGTLEFTVDEYLTTGIHDVGLVLEETAYYAYATNLTSFEVYKLNTTVGATPIKAVIDVGERQTITVIVSEEYAGRNATGFVNITVDGETYYKKLNSSGATQFHIFDLPKGPYHDIEVDYEGDDYFNGNSTKVSFDVGQTSDYNITVNVNDVTLGENATIYISLPTSVTQNLTVYVNNTKYENVVVKNGLAIVNVNSTVLNNPGQYVVNVTYPGDDVYALKYNNGTKFNVTATSDWMLNLNVEAHEYGQNTIFTVTLPSNVETKKLNLTIDGANHTVTINDAGIATLTLNNLSGGLHTVVANYTGDDRYVTKTNSTNFLVEKATSTTTLTQDTNGDVKATVTTNATGTVTFYVNGREYTVDLTGNVAVLDKNNLTIGNNSIIAVYNGDINFTSSKDSKNITIAKNTALVNVTATNETYGVPTEITVKVPKAQTGYVTITVNDTLVNVTVKIVNGEAKFNATGLDVGKYIVNVTYLGDDTYDVASNHTYFNITKNNNLIVDVIGQNVTVKENPSFVVNVTDEFNGKVNITIGGASYYDGDVKSLIDIDKLPAGTYKANVTFYGDNNYGNKSVEVEFKVSRVTPTINVTIDDVTYPTKSIAVVNMSDYANGTINITVDGKVFNGTVTNGAATIDLEGLSAGVKDALINFTTSDNYNGNLTSAVKFHIIKAKSTVNITQENQNVIATVTSGATGNVTFYINGKKYTEEVNDEGKAILENVLLNGNNTIVAIYSGDANFTSAFNATNNTVDLKDALVNVTATTVVYGNDSVITVEVPEVQKGYVRVTVNGTDIDVVLEIKDGIATFNATDLNAGRYKVNVTYLGDGTYGIKENSTFFDISKADLTASVIAQNVTVDENISFIISVLNDFNGNVSIEVDGKLYNGTVKTFIEMEQLLKGAKQATVTFYGDDNYNIKVINPTFTVSAVEPTINVTITDTTYPNNATATVKVSGKANGTIKIKVGDKTYSKEITNGEVTIDLNGLNAGLKEANVTFTSSDDYNLNANTSYKFFINKAKSHIEINVTPSGLSAGDDAIINITVSCTGKPVVYIDDQVIDDKELEDNRIIIDKTKLAAGKHTVVVYYPGDENYESSSESYTFTVDKREAMVNVTVEDTPYNDVAQIKVEVPISQTGYVTITVANKNYTAKLENGVAIFNVTGLDVDKYTVNVTYEGDENYTIQTNDTTFNVTQIKLIPTVLAVNVTDAMNSTFIIVVPDDYKGQVTITVDDETYTGNADSIIQMAKLTVGVKEAHVVFDDDKNYKGTELDVTFNVTKAEKQLPVTTVVNSTTVVVTVPENVTGNVTVVLPNGTNKTVVIENGSGIITLENMTPGENNITVIYTDGNNTITTNATITVPKYDTQMNVVVTGAEAGGNATVTVEVPVNATGSITVTLDGKTYTTDNITDGKAVITIENLTAGDKTLIVEYSGDSNYSANYTLANFTVAPGKVDSEITVVDLGNGTVVVVVGDNATGNVTITLDGQNFTGNVTNGTAVITLENITPGINVIEVIYSGDDTHTNSTIEANITGPKYDTLIEVNVTEVKEGEPVVVTVKVPQNATGNVTVTIDGKQYPGVIVNGTAIVTVDNLTAGDKTVVVEYSGDDNYAANYTIYNFTVEKTKVVPEIIVIDQGNGTVVVVVGDNATGNVTIKVGDDIYNATVVNGTAVVNLTNVTPGIHEIEVIYTGDDNHNGTNTTANITAPKYDASINVIVGEAKEGEAFNITVEVPVNATGDVIVSVGGKDYPGTIENGKAIVTVDDVSDGNHTIAVKYLGDDNYAANYSTSNVTVESAKSTPEIIVVDHGNGTVVVVVGDNATGNVTIKVGDNVYNATVVNGTAVVNIDNETPGIHEIEVIYSGDDNHNGTNTTANITVPKYDCEVNVTTTELDNGTVVVTVEVPVDATGNVTVNVGGKEYVTEIIDGGKAIVYVDDLAQGNQTVVVEYSGDDNYSGNYTISNLTKEAGKSDVDPVVVDYGNGTVVVVVGDNATGNVTIKVGDNVYNATVVNGTAVVNIDNETPGVHEIEVIYSGDDTHTNSTVNANITAPKYDSGMNVTVSEVKEGETAIVTVKVPANATGNVTVYIDGKNYTAEIKDDGTAVVEVENITGGSKTVTVVYSGDDNYAGNYTIYEFTVEKEKSTPNIIVEKDNNTVVVYVGDNATGNVTIKVGNETYNATVVNGTAIVNLTNVTPGVHDIEVIYSGDENHTNATINTNINIPKHESPININVNDISVGDKATITVEVPDKSTGTVTIEIDGEKYTKEIVNGVATFEVENLTAGDKSVSAVYEGDSNYARNFTSGQFKVSKVNSNLAVEIDDAKVGENITVTVHVPKDATGQVLIDIDGVGYYVNVTGGVGTVEIPYLPNGTYEVNLTYTGDDKYLSSTNKSTVTVSKLESFVIPTAHNIQVGENEIIKLKVPIGATGTVTVVIDTDEYVFNLQNGALGAAYKAGEKYTVAIAEGNGELIITGLPKGEYTVSVKYNGDEKYFPAVNTTIFTVSKKDTTMDVIDQGNGTIKVILPDDATGNVTVSDGNNTYVVEVINGTATIDLENTTPGKHDIEVKYSGDADHSSNKTTISVEVPKYETPISVEVEDINVGETETVIVTLPEGATGTVTIEINGKEYSTSEIVDGKATFKVDNLAFGNKTVAVKYSGDDKYQDNYTTGQFVVSKVSSTVKASGKDITVGKDEIITATVPSDATGRVLVDIDGVGYYGEIVNGKAKIIIPELPAGKYTASVTYEGDDKYLPSTNQVKFTVSKAKAPISAQSDDIEQGEDATVVVNVPSDATGTVTITVDGKKYTTGVKDGKAVFIVPGLTKGDYDITASYSGDKKYDANDTITDIEVYFNETPADNGSHKVPLSGENSGIALSKYATGNPIIALLLILVAIGSTQLRRFKP